ncbi:protein of unknown function [Pseudomonas mediterranea]
MAGGESRGAVPRRRRVDTAGDTRLSTHAKPVGAGLLAKAVYQSILQWLIHSHREQARSHTGSSMRTHSASGHQPLWERACSRKRSISRFFSG